MRNVLAIGIQQIAIDNFELDLLPPPNAIALWRGIPTLSAVADFS
jgi:hypothetical protein